MSKLIARPEIRIRLKKNMAFKSVKVLSIVSSVVNLRTLHRDAMRPQFYEDYRISRGANKYKHIAYRDCHHHRDDVIASASDLEHDNHQ